MAGADPGLPVGGCANPPGGGTPTYDFAKFCEKLHEIEKILGLGVPPLDPPLCMVLRFNLLNIAKISL